MGEMLFGAPGDFRVAVPKVATGSNRQQGKSVLQLTHLLLNLTNFHVMSCYF